jgi:DNA ligase-1
MEAALDEVIKLGGEGLMLRKPGSRYETGRSSTLLKVKKFSDAEATVISHTPGKGRHKGRCGALVVRMPNGKEFSLGTGLSDKERQNPPPVGAKVTYTFTELTDSGMGVPKCAAFLRVRPAE